MGDAQFQVKNIADGGRRSDPEHGAFVAAMRVRNRVPQMAKYCTWFAQGVGGMSAELLCRKTGQFARESLMRGLPNSWAKIRVAGGVAEILP